MSTINQETQAKELANEVTNYLNSFTQKNDEFNKAMSREHRTLQQKYTKMCLSWLEHCASDEYHFDGRNEASHKVSKDVVNGFRDAIGTTSNPSDWLPCI